LKRLDILAQRPVNITPDEFLNEVRRYWAALDASGPIHDEH